MQELEGLVHRKQKVSFLEVRDEEAGDEEASDEEGMTNEAKDEEAANKATIDIPPMPKVKSKNMMIADEMLSTLENVVAQMTGWHNSLGMNVEEKKDLIKQVMKNSASQHLGPDELKALLKPS